MSCLSDGSQNSFSSFSVSRPGFSSGTVQTKTEPLDMNNIGSLWPLLQDLCQFTLNKWRPHFDQDRSLRGGCLRPSCTDSFGKDNSQTHQLTYCHNKPMSKKTFDIYQHSAQCSLLQHSFLPTSSAVFHQARSKGSFLIGYLIIHSG